MDFLLEVDRFVQIIESPIFSFLRYELLDSEQNGDLILALYGLLNLIPQTTAFKTLNDRMKTLPRYTRSWNFMPIFFDSVSRVIFFEIQNKIPLYFFAHSLVVYRHCSRGISTWGTPIDGTGSLYLKQPHLLVYLPHVLMPQLPCLYWFFVLRFSVYLSQILN